MLDLPHRDQVALRTHDGAFCATDLTARHPRTGEVLSTMTVVLQPSPLSVNSSSSRRTTGRTPPGLGHGRLAVVAAKRDTARTA
ncbi:hypothetical protein ACFQ78_28215 [Streptomyces sp. NPDC056519]|uniref:hypothetical protein n=1 Tax=Streptomyces sp. NPDC056519 TaxID=3345849 RepID=UPI0036B04D81